MSYQTMKVDKVTINNMQVHYKHVLDNKPPQGAIFRAKTENAVITAYQSGKVLFQGKNVDAEVNKWQGNDADLTLSSNSHIKKQVTTYTPPNNIFTQSHIGSDESGTGDYFGPITTAAVYVTTEQISLLKQLGIQDSKAINDKNVQALAKELATMNIPYSLMILHNGKYNRLQQSGWSQGKMKAMLHHAAINQLLKKIESSFYKGIVIDQFCQPTVYERYLASEQQSIPPHTFFMTKAENSSIAVAAGSVIARASFLQEMERLSEQIGHSLLKGASKQVDKLIATIMKENDESTLQQIAKVHFANTKKAAAYM